jgi:riboflavin synthase
MLIIIKDDMEILAMLSKNNLRPERLVRIIFTGIVEEMGNVNRLERGSHSGRITVSASRGLEDVKLGDSIAINGVCLTVVEFDRHHFVADVMAETIDKTNLKELGPGSQVNLERAVRLADRMGGHLVQGHVDGVGVIIEDKKLDIARIIKIKAGAEVLDFTVPKGSIAIDGISLTVVDVFADSFTVSLIPHTASLTTLGFKKSGHTVNLETDIIGRYVYKFLNKNNSQNNNTINMNFLAENGFL